MQAFFTNFRPTQGKLNSRFFSKLKQILNLNSKIRQFLYNFKAKIESFPIKLQILPPKLKEFSPKPGFFFTGFWTSPTNGFGGFLSLEKNP